jgi:hypothetical protein
LVPTYSVKLPVRIMRSASFYWLTTFVLVVYLSVAGVGRSYPWERIPSLKLFGPLLVETMFWLVGT